MSIVTIYGDLEWGDAAALQQFLDNHDQAHRDLNQVVQQKLGIALNDYFLARAPDHDWFADHWLLHKALDEALKTPGAPGLSGEWPDPTSFYDWHQIHNEAHRAYGLVAGVE